MGYPVNHGLGIPAEISEYLQPVLWCPIPFDSSESKGIHILLEQLSERQ